MRPYKPGLREEQVRDITDACELVKISSNESPFPPFTTALAAGERALRTANRYPDGGAHELKTALSARLDVDEAYIVVGNGSNELLMLLAYATLGVGDEVVYGWPSFIVYPLMCELTGATAVPVALNEREEYDLDAMREAITERTKIVVLCNPNNPTGTIYTREAFAAFMDTVPRDVLVVVDEAYFEFVAADAETNALEWFDGERPLVVLRTFSKAYAMAGMRCGYGVMPVALAEALGKIRAPFNVNVAAQAMATAALADNAELARRTTVNAEGRRRIEEACEQLGITYAASQANFVWVHAPRPQGAFQALLKKGIIVRDFGDTPALRIGVGSPDEVTRTIAALEALVEEGTWS